MTGSGNGHRLHEGGGSGIKRSFEGFLSWVLGLYRHLVFK